MHLELSPELRQAGYEKAVRRASQWLAEEIGPSATRARAEWDLTRDYLSNPMIRLKLTDPFSTGEVEQQFAPHELESERSLRRRFRDLWGEVLQDGSHRLVARILQPSDEPE